MTEQEVMQALDGKADSIAFLYDKSKQLVAYKASFIQEQQLAKYVFVKTGEVVECWHGQAKMQMRERIKREGVIKRYVAFARSCKTGFYQSDKGIW